VTIRDKLEATASVAFIGVAVLLSAALIKAYFLPAPSRSIPRAAVAGGAATSLVGASLKDRIPGVDWSKNGRTLVLAISTQCHFCKDSTPFYRKLEAQGGKGMGVHVDQVKQAGLGEIGVSGTPTMLLVNSSGIITKIWVGMLQPEAQEQVLSVLKKG
jgi:hypothetical protein